MAFTSRKLTDRMEELRFPLRSPTEEYPYSPARGQNSFFSNYPQNADDSRSALHRRFTTDSSKASVGGPFGPQSQLQRTIESVTMSSSSRDQSLSDKKRQKIEILREQKRKYEEHMKLLDIEEQLLQQGNSGELEQISRAINSNRESLIAGAVSEPTTPPDFSQAGFPSSLSRLPQSSMNSLTSPPGLTNRLSSTSTQVTSPTSSGKAFAAQGQLFKSLPGSRRNSDEEEDYLPQELPFNRSGTALNRFSLPVNGTKKHRSSMGAFSTTTLGQLNTTSFLFDDEDEKHVASKETSRLASPISSTLADEFPTLRSDRNSGILSANSAALDLANPPKSSQPHRHSLQSMPTTGPKHYRLSDTYSSATGDRSVDSSAPQTPTAKPTLRHSVGIGFGTFGDQHNLDQKSAAIRPLSLQSSYSTNDLPTIKTTKGTDSLVTPPKTHAEQHFHNHNASLGRIPQGAMSNRQSRDLATIMSPSEAKREDSYQSNVPSHSLLQASAPPFTAGSNSSSNQPAAMPYNPQVYPAGIQNYTLAHLSQQPFPMAGQMQMYQNQGQFPPYQTFNAYGRAPDTQPRFNRRGQNPEDARSGFATPIEHARGQIATMAKDQNGCRQLQKTIESGNADEIQMIFEETCPHVIELMTDPFGNYLMQKLLEHASDRQRSDLVKTAAPAMVTIAVNQHGTRALQKMIEYISLRDQVQNIVLALRDHVTPLVQDLNGNHVIQKCLNRLSAEDSQFIYNAVGRDCIDVGTHRHGCCVIQRCIDHSNGRQRAELIKAITERAFALCTDPYGNYVVQYILDLCEPNFTAPLCKAFEGNVCALAKQKFSSNVVEKAIRTADMSTRRDMITEMLPGAAMEALVRDAYANYVVQTALEYADLETKERMIDTIRPLLPGLKNTPHGRRISSKILNADGVGRNGAIGTIPNATTELSSPIPMSASRQTSANSGRRHIGIYGNNIFQNNAAPHYVAPAYADNNNLESAFTSLTLSNQNGQSHHPNHNTPPIFSAMPHGPTPPAGPQSFASYTGGQGHPFF